jgi:hypothetical protein
MPWIPFAALVVLGMVFSLLAWFHTSSPSATWRVLWLGPFAGRHHFTKRGWQYRNWALIVAVLAAAVLLTGVQ